MQTLDRSESVAAILSETLDLLQDHTRSLEIRDDSDGEHPASLLQQCLGLCKEQEAAREEPLRTVHHFACTGGSLLSKCLGTMPNVQLLSEVTPAAEHRLAARPEFAPTDLIKQLAQGSRSVETDVLAQLFKTTVQEIFRACTVRGQRLVLREHTHGKYCIGDRISNAPGLRELLQDSTRLRSIVSVRHPVDSWLSLLASDWVHFEPKTFREYCNRYRHFLDDHSDVPIFRYEEFVRGPESEMKRICNELAIPFNGQFVDIFDAIAVTGDSGRSSGRIAPRPRRKLEVQVKEDILNDLNRLNTLCRMMGYDDTDIRHLN